MSSAAHPLNGDHFPEARNCERHQAFTPEEWSELWIDDRMSLIGGEIDFALLDDELVTLTRLQVGDSPASEEAVRGCDCYVREV